MKTKLMLASLAIACAAASGSALAADGQVVVSGQVTATTCQINGSSAGDVVQNVTLPTVSELALAAPASFAGTTGVAFAISGCDVGTTVAEAHFEPVTGAFTANGNMANTAGSPADKVEIQLLDKNYEVINLLSGSATADLVGGAGTLQMYARYYAPTGGATAGDVAGSAMFSLTYL